MSYVTVFEITHQSIPLWFPFSFVIFGLLGTILFLLTWRVGLVTKGPRYVLLLLACLWVVSTAYYFLDRRHYVQAYRNGEYSVVEGAVEHYSWRGKTECFSVRGREFCRGTANQIDWPVALTHEGVLVRVAYSSEKYPRILRLDIGLNAR
jgi:hypothetical protein